MLQDQTRSDSYTAFAAEVEPRIRHALIPLAGVDGAGDATADALAYGWEHWERIRAMDNPAGYLYRVGQTSARRLRRRAPVLPAVSTAELPWIEPGLPAALAKLSDRQRTVVWLVHGMGWSQVDVAELLGLSAASIATHLRRGMKRLRRSLGGEE